MKGKQDIRELSTREIQSFLTKNNEHAFRVKQIEEWLWKKTIRSFDEMTNLSKDLRTLLKRNFELKTLTTRGYQLSNDGTVKVAFGTYDHKTIEGVLIPSAHRVTGCISSQIGCNLGCKFCATGSMGLHRNLNAWEIFDQVIELEKIALSYFKMKLSNIVFMGMGEPLMNYDNTLKAIDLLTSSKGQEISPRRITISTAGIPKKIRQLADDNPKTELAISLNTADNETRSEIMPINAKNGISALIDAVKYYHHVTGKRVTFEYILFSEINDHEADAYQLADFCSNFPCKINLIEYNSVKGMPFEKPTPKTMRDFKEYLEARNLVVNVRNSKGEDISAACGQLANKSNPEQEINVKTLTGRGHNQTSNQKTQNTNNKY